MFNTLYGNVKNTIYVCLKLHIGTYIKSLYMKKRFFAK